MMAIPREELTTRKLPATNPPSGMGRPWIAEDIPEDSVIGHLANALMVVEMDHDQLDDDYLVRVAQRLRGVIDFLRKLDAIDRVHPLDCKHEHCNLPF